MGHAPSVLSGKVKLETAREANTFLCSVNPVRRGRRLDHANKGEKWDVAVLDTFYLVPDDTLHVLFDDVKAWYLDVIEMPLIFDPVTGRVSHNSLLGDYGQVLTQDGFILHVGTPRDIDVNNSFETYYRQQYETAKRAV